MPYTGHRCDFSPELATLGGEADMLGGIPADTFHAEAGEFLHVGLAAGGNFAEFGVYVAVVAELAVGD